MASMTEFLKQAAHVKPNENQLRLLRETPFYAFVHFSPNTYTGVEWGDGGEAASIFNPTQLDCDQWCETIKSAGMKGAVLTAKHHDGFCLWQTAYTEHSMKNSPYKNGKGDIVREFSDACRRHGLKFGFYLSPWDRHSPLYGTDAYNDYYRAQLTELLTNYGEIFHVWFDGACGEGPNGKKQVYDFDSYIALIKKYQPNATIFSDRGQIRWCGNESGTARYSEWAVVPSELCPYCEIQTAPGPLYSKGSLDYMYNTDENIGSVGNIIYSKGLVFAPAEVDMSIRPGWFYRDSEKPHSLDRLFKTYLDSVGSNATFILNVPPTPNEKFNDEDVARLKELGDKIRSEFAVDLAQKAEISVSPYNGSETQRIIDIVLGKTENIKYIELCENIAHGQRIENYFIQKPAEGGKWLSVYEGTTVGNRKIVPLDNVETNMLRIFIASSRDVPEISEIKIY